MHCEYIIPVFLFQQSYIPEDDSDDDDMVDEDPVFGLTSVLNITDRKVEYLELLKKEKIHLPLSLSPNREKERVREDSYPFL